MNCIVAINHVGGGYLKTGELKTVVFTPAELQLIGEAYYKWVQIRSRQTGFVIKKDI